TTVISSFLSSLPHLPRSTLFPYTTLFRSLFLSEADQYWSLPSEAVLKTLRKAAVESDQPLARHAALAALGRVADPKGLEPILASLGAPTKVVQVGASWALRAVAARRGTRRKEIAAAFSPADHRSRGAAPRVLTQHFR